MKSDKSIKIFVVCHKPCAATKRKNNIFVPIQAGHAISNYELGIATDDTGDNISDKNLSYCELTAIYWVWKNVTNVETVGFEHYRRHFKFNGKELKKTENGVLIINPELGDCRVVDKMVRLTSSEDVLIMIDELINQYPHWRNSVESYFWRSNKMTVGNMFIMPWSVFDSYASFLFSFLQSLESRILFSPYHRQQRIFGYFGEVLLGFWLHANNVKYDCVMGSYNDCTSVFRRNINKIRNNLAFYISPQNKKISFHASIIDGLKSQGYQLNNF